MELILISIAVIQLMKLFVDLQFLSEKKEETERLFGKDSQDEYICDLVEECYIQRIKGLFNGNIDRIAILKEAEKDAMVLKTYRDEKDIEDVKHLLEM